MMRDVNVDPTVDDSDYGGFGSDAEELDILHQLVAQTERDIEDEPHLRLPKIPGLQTHSNQDIRYDTEEHPQRTSTSPEPRVPEDRSPLERFRRPPKKSFSVTDLVSPAWCELQFYYSLVEPQRKKKTAAMKQGSEVHQALEDEVHVTVPVKIVKKEDKWGLKIWNMIQGLRTLRDTGLTREFEVWGTVGGEVVNGIIDELSYTCPDPKIEAESLVEILLDDQRNITEYLISSKDQTKTVRHHEKIYITDVKTRGFPTLPTGSSIRPTILQLHLYYFLLQNLVLGNFHVRQLAERYDFDVDETFSDSFIMQIGALNQELFDFASSQEHVEPSTHLASTQDSVDIILQHNNCASLWEYMISEMRTVFLLPVQLPQSLQQEQGSEPRQASDKKTRLSTVLTVEYLAPNYQHVSQRPKKSIGKKSFGFNPTYLNNYLEDNMSWWRGQRQARGVKVEDAWKCRRCDFRKDCTWIQERDGATLRDALEKKRMRDIAAEGKTNTGAKEG